MPTQQIKGTEFDTVAYLKQTTHQSPYETVKRLSRLCKERGIDIPTLLRVLVRSNCQGCFHNFIGDADHGYCTDRNGEEVAYGLDAIAEAYGYDKNGIRCKDVNDRGCCAKINKMLFNLEEGLYECLEKK